MRYLTDCFAAALIAAAFLALRGLVKEIVPHLSSVASAAPGERAENAPPRPAAWGLPMARIGRFLRRFVAERAARRAIRELEAMNELELRDLAVYRADIRRVVREGR